MQLSAAPQRYVTDGSSLPHEGLAVSRCRSHSGSASFSSQRRAVFGDRAWLIWAMRRGSYLIAFPSTQASGHTSDKPLALTRRDA